MQAKENDPGFVWLFDSSHPYHGYYKLRVMSEALKASEFSDLYGYERNRDDVPQRRILRNELP